MFTSGMSFYEDVEQQQCALWDSCSDRLPRAHCACFPLSSAIGRKGCQWCGAGRGSQIGYQRRSLCLLVLCRCGDGGKATCEFDWPVVGWIVTAVFALEEHRDASMLP